MKTLSRSLLLFLTSVFLFPSVLSAQGAFFQPSPATTTIGTQVITLPAAQITVCGFPAVGVTATTPCTNKASIFTDQTFGVSSANPFNADQQGNFSWWAVSGGYTYSICTTASVVQCVNYNAPATMGQTSSGGNTVGSLNSHTIFADAQAGADIGAKINAALALAVAGDTVDARGFTTNQSVSTIVLISKGVRLLLPGVTLTCVMADPGTSSGCFNVTANNATFEGVKGQTVITQPNAQRIQVGIQIGSSTNFTMKYVGVNWNEANQTAPGGQFYTFLRSTAGATDIRIEDNDFKACGDRCIDFRATSRVWIKRNYFHETGINVHGTGGTGNATSVDVTGNTSWEDAWIDDNQFELWGDTAVACPHGSHCHANGNTLRGAIDCSATFPCGSTTSASPSSIESGIDFVGCSDCEAVGNHIINVFNFSLDSENQTVGAVTYIPSNVRIIGNEFRHNTGAGADCLINFGAALASGQLSSVTIASNTFSGCRLGAGDIAGLTIAGNTFRDVGTFAGVHVALTMSQSNSVLKDFTVSENSFATTDGSVTTAIFVSSAVTTPGNSSLGPNMISSSITTALSNAGKAIPLNKIDNYQLYRRTSDTIAPTLDLFKARGTADAPTTVANADFVGNINVWGFDGTNYLNVAQTPSCTVQGVPSAGIIPTRCKFQAMNASGALVNFIWLLGDVQQMQFTGDVFPDANASRSFGIAGLRWKFFGNTTNSDLYQTSTNCASSGGTCAAAAAGAVSIAAAASTVTVATTAVTANSDITLTRNDALGTRLSVTCNTATAAGDIKVSTITPGTSFVITVQNAPAVNPLCLTYSLVN